MSSSVCRVCANSGNFCLPIDTKYENLPISVVIQVICPIRILDDDYLPRVICAECYNTVLSAYKLREKSLISDKLLKEKLESTGHCSQRPSLKRPRPELNKSLPVKTEVASKQTTTKKAKVNSRASTSFESHRRSTNENATHDDFPDSTNDQPCDELKMLSRKKEDIINKLYEDLINPKLSDDPDMKPLRCTKVACANSHKLFESEDLLKVHHAFEHANVLTQPTMHPIYYVRPEAQAESYMRAFGILCWRGNAKTADAEHYYCKLCISKGVQIKFVRTIDKKDLLTHVLSHLDARAYQESENSEEQQGVPLKKEKKDEEDETQENESLLDEDGVVFLLSDDEEESSMNDDEADLENLTFKYATTKMGNVKIIIDGYSFAKKHDSATAQYFKCIKRVRVKIGDSNFLELSHKYLTFFRAAGVVLRCHMTLRKSFASSTCMIIHAMLNLYEWRTMCSSENKLKIQFKNTRASETKMNVLINCTRDYF